MSNVIDGQLTLAEIVRLTYTSKYRTRFKYMKRDVIKKIIITKETELHPDRPGEPTVRFNFETRSWPQYYPYNKHTGGRQRKYHHEYDSILTIQASPDGTYSMNTTFWKYRLGSQKKWNDKPPQAKIKSLYRETSKAWRKDYLEDYADIKFHNPVGERRDKLLAKRKKVYEDKIKKHKKSAVYLDVGDFNSRVNSINADAYFLMHPILAYYGHLYGKNVHKGSIPDYSKPFICKHGLRLIDELIKLGILKEF